MSFLGGQRIYEKCSSFSGSSLGSRSKRQLIKKSHLCEAKDRGFGGIPWGNSRKSWTIHVIDLSPLAWAERFRQWRKDVSFSLICIRWLSLNWAKHQLLMTHFDTVVFRAHDPGFFSRMPLGHGCSRTGDRIGTLFLSHGTSRPTWEANFKQSWSSNRVPWGPMWGQLVMSIVVFWLFFCCGSLDVFSLYFHSCYARTVNCAYLANG